LQSTHPSDVTLQSHTFVEKDETFHHEEKRQEAAIEVDEYLER
jgi:hypothetical protein